MTDLETLAFESSLDMENRGRNLVEVKKEEPEQDWMDHHFGLTLDSVKRSAEALSFDTVSPNPEHDRLDVSADIKPVIPSTPLFGESSQRTVQDDVDSCSLPVHIFQSMLDSVMCSVCGERDVKVKYDREKYTHDFSIYCMACGDVLFC